jgi:hypothetical protein
MTTQHYKRPANVYTGETGLPNRTKYFSDSTASPKRPISSEKVDGDFNYLIDAINEIYDTAVSGVVADGSVTNAKIRDSAGCSVIGRSTATTGVVADITAAGNDVVLVRKSNVLQFGTIPAGALEADSVTTASISDTNVTFPKIQNVNTGVLLGRATAGAGSVEALTVGTGLSASAGTVTLANATDTAIGGVELATTAETQTGSDATRAITPAGLKTALGFSRFYESGEISLTTSATNSAAHGLGGLPRLVTVILRCKTADVGYSVGAEINYPSGRASDANNGLTPAWDSANISLIVGTAGTGTIGVARPDTRAGAALTNSSWVAVIRAWA